MINVKVLLFANFKELVGKAEQVTAIEEGNTIDDLCKQLALQGDVWNQIFSDPDKNIKIACNQKMADLSCVLHAGDEVAFFPPVTGG